MYQLLQKLCLPRGFKSLKILPLKNRSFKSQSALANGVLQGSSETSNERIPLTDLFDEGFDVPLLPIMALVTDFDFKAQILRSVEHGDDRQMAPQEILQAVLIGILRLAKRMPVPTPAVLNLDPMIIALPAIRNDDRLGKPAQSDIGFFATVAGISGETNDPLRQNVASVASDRKSVV